MHQHADIIFGSNALQPLQTRPTQTMGRLRRYTLVLLRWGAIGGQILALLCVSLILEFPYPVLACCAVIAASIFINLAITVLYPLDRRVSDREALLQLGFDILQLAALLWLTGGITNPFAILFLAPIVTSATTLSKSVLFILSALATLLSFSLVFHSQPLPWDPDNPLMLPFTFRIGVWIAIMVGSIFTSLYAWRATKESRKMAAALAATETMLAQEQKLSALGGLAAAAAHELGTPLATIQVTAKEMTREIPKGSPLADDAALVLSQSQRCRSILEQLALRGDEGDAIHDRLTLEDLFEEAAEPFILIEPDIIIEVSGTGPEPELKRQAELVYALKNFIENAVDFASEKVRLCGVWNETTISVFIDDDGPGFDPTLTDRLGQPYVTKRSRQKSKKPTAGGLGLGVFIASTLVERTGGQVAFKRGPLGGARVEAVWPRDALVAKAS
ncbi:two-component system sensor histidine kinase RegB [Litorimonas taeanensis]|uniref:histidine kinase n=1 Tax=Litorimonas taeanensis TaxID=568099 RepID=A0A420WF38_9PROT|nr:ActS/PrrB/RegB family redox-sensitive histidine kinase [Litorimonas taeanensis]RKQ69600.1 two-component system sensor histidine kinase RegB [Litorimonas taeanensis]